MRVERIAIVSTRAVIASPVAFHAAFFMCAMLNVQTIRHCNQMARVQTITSAANPLIKDIRRAIARGSLTDEGWCVAESFHLLEEALRSDCEVKTVLASESVRSAAEAHVRGLNRTRIVALPDALFQRLSG